MAEPSRTLTASSPEHLLIERITIQEQQMADGLAPYEPQSTTYAWFDTLRAIEECINLIHVDWDDDEFEDLLFSLPLGPYMSLTSEFQVIRQRFIAQFGENFANRFTNLLVYSANIAIGFGAQGFFDIAAAFSTVGSMIGYLQSRRRHFLALLHMLPTACRGDKVVIPYDALLVFLPMIELIGIQLRSAQNALNIKLARAKLNLPEVDSSEIAMLDPFFLEPERVPITSMAITEMAIAKLAALETLSPDRLFSAAELRNDILQIEAAYAEFDLKETEFAPAAALVRRLSTTFVDRDFWVIVTPDELAALFEEFKLTAALQEALLNKGPTYLQCLSTYAPLVAVNGLYRSTVTLLSRFTYYWRGRSLDHQKRFQIRAGFIFETAIADELRRQDFVVKDVRRINRREFDVVTVRAGVIWNIQCKNNFTDLDHLEANAARFATYNYRLVRAYEKALLKEKNREHLLKDKLSLDEVQHMVVSRFPVVTDNPRFVPYSRITNFGEIADAMMAYGAGS